jgi:predicted secreted protein
MCRQQEEGEVLLQRKKSRPDIENLYVKNTLVQNFRHKTVTQSKDIKETYFLQCLEKSGAQTEKNNKNRS